MGSGNLVDSLFFCDLFTTRPVVSGPSALPLIPRLPQASLVDLDAARTVGHLCWPPIADMPSIASQQRIGVRDPGKNRAGDLHGKSVAACGGILYTSTSYLLRGRRSHEHRRPQP